MYQLNYHSKSRLGLEREDLDDILKEAISANAARNISGCLIYHNGSFVQILEGRKKDVLHIYKKIKADERHHKIILLWENQVDKRFFAEWNMAYHHPDDKNVKQFVNNLLLLSQLSDMASRSLLSFWSTVGKILRGDTTSNSELRDI